MHLPEYNPTHASLDQARIAEVDLMKGPHPSLRDDFGRMHNYLRISAWLPKSTRISLEGS
jgi:hypothetical protein